MTRLTRAAFDGPIDILAMRTALDASPKGAATIDTVTPYSDGSVRLEGRHWNDPHGAITEWVVTASANGYVEYLEGANA